MKYAAYSITRNLYMIVTPSVKSLLMHTDVDRIFLLIEDDEFPEPLPDCVTTINVSDQTFFPPDGANARSRFTYMAMMRAALPFVLDVDRVLSLDPDVIFLKDAPEIFGLDVDNYYLSASREWHKSTDSFLYINAGVVLYNLKKLREDGKAKEIIDYLNVKKLEFVEQDAINELCQGGILPMDATYNSNPWTNNPRNVEFNPDPKVIHFAGSPVPEWINSEIVSYYRGIPWNQIRGGLI